MTTQMIEEKLWDLSMEISKLRAENKLLKSFNDRLIQALHKPVVVRGGDKDDNLSTIERTMLTTEAGAKSQSDGRRCTHFWSENKDGTQECLFCPATRPARKSSEGAL